MFDYCIVEVMYCYVEYVWLLYCRSDVLLCDVYTETSGSSYGIMLALYGPLMDGWCP